MHKTRIELTDSIFDIAFKMSDGNPGAITALVDAVKNGAAVDPDDAFQGLGCILSLDTNRIYGADIYVLWNDLCGRDLKRFIASTRVIQLGLIPDSEVKQAIKRANNDRGAADHQKPDEWLKLVQVRLPNFGKN